MLACLVVSCLLCAALGYVLVRSMPPSGRPLRYQATVRVFWKLTVVTTIAFGAAYLAQRHAEAQQSETEQRVWDLEQQVNDLQQAVADLQDNQVDQR